MFSSVNSGTSNEGWEHFWQLWAKTLIFTCPLDSPSLQCMWKRTWTWAEAQFREHKEHWNLWRPKTRPTTWLNMTKLWAVWEGHTETWFDRGRGLAGKKSQAPCSYLHCATDTHCDPRVCLPWKQQITNPWSWKGLWANSKSSVIILEMRHTLETCHARRPSRWKSQDWSSSLLTPNQGFLTCRCKWIRGYTYKSPKNPELKSTNRYKWMWINAAVWMFVYPPNFHVGILTPKVMVLESGAFRSWLGCEGRALGTEISAPTEASQQSNSAPSAT